MKPNIEALVARMRALQEEIEEVYHQARQELEREQAHLAGEFLRRQRSFRVGLVRYLLECRPVVVLTSPLIYLGWLPFALLDLFVTVYQGICFPIYGIARVRRSSFLVFDRARLPYLNAIERFNCFYCSYANGIAAYAREVAARTEQYWCPIKHARRIAGAHDRYPNFVDYGNAQAYRIGLDELRQRLKAVQSQQAEETEKKD